MMRRILHTVAAVAFATAAMVGAASAADPAAPPLVAPGAGGAAVLENRIGPGFGPGNCLTTVLSGGVDLEFCSLEYHVEAGAVFCSGLVELRDGIFHLGRAHCDVPGRVFHGGSMSCGRGYFCDWRPSRAAAAEGFLAERVKIYFPEPARFRFRPRLRT
jgi:hypothetical protein